jgi:hypothetical protein
MIECRKHVRLTAEPRDAVGVAGEGIGEQLDGDVAPELRIARAIHLPHSAGADGRHDLVRAESNARSQGHSERMILRISDGGLRICYRISADSVLNPQSAIRNDYTPCP